MRVARRRLRAAVAVSVAVILLGSLLPVIGQVLLRAVDGQRFDEICTSAGLVRIALRGADAEHPAHPVDPGAAGGHCPFCLPHAGHCALPPTFDGGFWLPSAERGPLPFVRHTPPRPQPAWPDARPRAPPPAS